MSALKEVCVKYNMLILYLKEGSRGWGYVCRIHHGDSLGESSLWGRGNKLPLVALGCHSRSQIRHFVNIRVQQACNTRRSWFLTPPFKKSYFEKLMTEERRPTGKKLSHVYIRRISELNSQTFFSSSHPRNPWKLFRQQSREEAVHGTTLET